LCNCKADREYVNEFNIGGKEVCTSIRPWKCGINCLSMIDFCRPEIEVRVKEKKKIGSVEWPCWCGLWCPRGLLSCMEFDVKDGEGNIIYKISAPCYQLGFLCWCCGWLDCYTKRIVLREESRIANEDKAAVCSKRAYYIKTPEDGKVVGEIYNFYNGVCYEVFSRADKYGIHFPQGCSKDHKMLLI